MPAQSPVFRYLLLILPTTFLLISAARLYAFFQERDDIWWTPRAMSIPLEAAHDRVRVYLHGNEMDDLVAARRLLLQNDSGTSAVSRQDIGLRFNNWDRVRAERIPALLISAVTVGAAAGLLLSGLIITLAGPPSGMRPDPRL
jgi:hypothetical protein